MGRSVIQPFKVTLLGTEFAVRDALHKILNALTPLGLDVEETGAVELVLAEVLNNIVEHAYVQADIPEEITVSCKQSRNGLHFSVRDRGAPMPDGKMPLGALAPKANSIAGLPEGGFGWFLIQNLAKDLEYRHDNGENQLNLRIAVGIPD